jgi:hypothetical protein
MDEEEVAKTWPGLCTLVWPDWTRRLRLRTWNLDKLMGPALGPSAVEKALGQRKHGVVELAQGLEDLLGFGDLPGAICEALQEPAAKVGKTSRSLAKALSDWDVQRANALTNELESALDLAEKAAEQFKAV